ncbi:MAG: hypothetical protein ABIG71_01345 [Candidatus Uhrbacteria bacterium]
MRKTLPLGIGTAVAVLAIALGAVAFREQAVSVTLNIVPDNTVYGGDPAALALDFVVSPGRADVLDALVVEHRGTAELLTDITGATLWRDEGVAGFQGIGIDRTLASGSWNGAGRSWVFTDTREPIPEDGARFFVTVASTQSPTHGRTILLRLPPYSDSGHAMEYSIGDRGIFLRTGRAAPELPLENSRAQVLTRSSADEIAPTSRILAVGSGTEVGSNWILVNGVAEDRGGSVVSNVRIGINRQGNETEWFDASLVTPGFATWEARFFQLTPGATYELRTQASDWVNNTSAVSDPMIVTLKGEE